MGTLAVPACVEADPRWTSLVSKLNKLAVGAEATESSEFSVKCEMCTTEDASVYCGQDKAHLCAACDESHHASSKLLMKHARLPLYHSPFQFGTCATHQSDKYECVCLECGELLCQLCLLVGSHADKTAHPIVSTIEAFRLSLSPPEAARTIAGAETFLAVTERKEAMLAALRRKHSLIMQAESNHWQIQQLLDKELRSALDVIAKSKKKRTEYLHALRRENLLLLTLAEWFQAFAVHARLALPPSLWLSFYRRIRSAGFRELVAGADVKPVESIAGFIETLPKWVNTRVEIGGFIDVFNDSIRRERITGGKPVIASSQFEWIPPRVPEFDVPQSAASPEQLRKNRMETHLDALLGKPQPVSAAKASAIPFPSTFVNDPIPLDNVKDFVMQTLAVLTESEHRIPELDFAPWTRDISSDIPAPPSKNEPDDAVPRAGLPPSLPLNPEVATAVADTGGKLRKLLYEGAVPFDNAVAVLLAAPSSERQDLVRMLAGVFRDPENASLLEELIQAICKSTVDKIDASSFLVSGVSVLVPLTAAFALTLFPADATFIDSHIQEMLVRVVPQSQSVSDLTALAESSIGKLLATLAAPSTNVAFPSSIRFLLQAVHEACSARFSPQVSTGVVSGLFLARLLSPRLVFLAPKSNTELQAPQIITLMTRYVHRIAGAAAEGQSALSRSSDPQSAVINNSVSQINGLLTRCVLSRPKDRLPLISSGLTPRSASARLERKLRDYGRLP